MMHGLCRGLSMSESLEDLQLRASAGDVEAMALLASRLDFGDDVAVDRAAAARWYRAAAEHGHATSMFNLGSCYSRGEGVEQDLREAARWYRAAAALGESNAIRVLDATGILYVAPAQRDATDEPC
jgi:hypothetical protein